MIAIRRKELSKKYNLSDNTWTRRHDDLMEYLNDFMEIKEIKQENGRFIYEVDELPDSIPPLPRKNDTEQKRADYERFAIAALGTEFQYNSKAKVSREAIAAFGFDKYGHKSYQSVSRNYVGPTMEKNGERSEEMTWVFYNTYEALSDEELDDWIQILTKHNITEKQQACAFRKAAKGGNIEKEISFYNAAMDEFKEKYGSFPIKVYSWKVK